MPRRPKAFRLRPAPPPEVTDRERGSARERGYTPEWDKASAAHRREFRLCQYCEAGAFGTARARPATCVDHLYPHRRYGGFWKREWWASSCDECHSGPKQIAEAQGKPALDRLAILLGRPILTDAGGRGGSKV